MVGLGLGFEPGVPYLGSFWKTNVRLYLVDGSGRRAVVFRSLDASRLVPVLVAQATLRLPCTPGRTDVPGTCQTGVPVAFGPPTSAR
ncbi:hypothetical protein GCM10029963_23100 [Micromonospora andamanensis]|nr:hypothetical protein Vwe01_49430 [Micromonospora andamanensis]